jgi:hypothetical protein
MKGGGMMFALFDAFKNLLVSIQVWGSSQVPTGMRSPDVFKKIQAVAITAGTPVAVWTPAAGKKFRMMGYHLGVSTGASVIFEDASGAGNEFLRVPILAAAANGVSPPLGNGYLSTAANNALYLDVTVSASVSGYVYGVEE